jgi:hypothetical protein
MSRVMNRIAAAPLLLALALAAACSEQEPPTTAPAPSAASPAGTPTGTPAAANQSAPTSNAPPANAPPAPEAATPKRVINVGEGAEPVGPAAYQIDPPEIRLGVVEPNGYHDVEFTLKNVSDRPFNVIHATTECKCIVADVSREMIKPGASIPVKMRVQATSAGVRKTATVLHLTDAARSKPRLEVRYAIAPEILLEPRGVGFGRVESGKAAEQSLRVTLHLPQELEKDPVLEPFLAHELPITWWFDPPVVTPMPGGGRDWVATLHVKLESKAPIPLFASHLVFRPKEKNHFRELLVRVTGEVVPSWYFERGVVGFGSVTVGELAEKEMRFFFPAGEPPKIERLDTTIEGLEIEQSLDAERHCFLLKLKLTPRQPGKIEGGVNLLTSLSPEPAVLQVTARAK